MKGLFSQAGPVPTSERILSGLSAEMADYESDSEGDEENDPIQQARHKFTPPDHVKILLKSKYSIQVHSINLFTLKSN